MKMKTREEKNFREYSQRPLKSKLLKSTEGKILSEFEVQSTVNFTIEELLPFALQYQQSGSGEGLIFKKCDTLFKIKLL
jgi:hypothetical protein